MAIDSDAGSRRRDPTDLVSVVKEVELGRYERAALNVCLYRSEPGRRQRAGIPASTFALRATADRGKAGTTSGDLVCSTAFRRRWLCAGIDRIIGDRKNPPSLLAMVDKTDRL